ncbi:MAG: hypothetical protein ABR556_01830 [Pyrinomonadaceae bacterium]
MNSINVAIAHIKPKRFLGNACRTEKEYRLRERWYQEPLRPDPGQTSVEKNLILRSSMAGVAV